MRLAPSFIQHIAAKPERAEDSLPKIEPVLLVHGTFANVFREGVVDWWRPGSDYARSLDERLQALGSQARCWSHLANANQAPFAWSGANTERARRDAGRALAHEIARLEADTRVAQYHLVAHSHGGNVVLNALREVSQAPAKLGAVVYMGTPCLTFHHAELPDMRWFSIPLYLVLMAGCAWVWASRQTGEENQLLWGSAVAVLLLAVVSEIFFAGRRELKRTGNLYGSGHARAFVFAGDEAIGGLMLAQETAKHPLRFIKQFVSSAAPSKRPAVRVTSPPARGLNDELANSGVAAVLDLLEDPSPSQGYAGLLGLPGTPAPARRLTSGAAGRIPPSWRSTVQFVEAGAAGFPVVSYLKVGLWVCLLAPRLAVAALVGIWVLAKRMVGFAIGKLGMLVAIALAAVALPRLIRQGAFGADQGRFVRVSGLPPGVPQREQLSAELTADAKAVGDRFGGLTGRSLLDAMSDQDAFSIKAYVERALSDAEFVHSFYYQAPEIISATSALVAKPPALSDLPPEMASLSRADWGRVAAALRGKN